jgi:DNA-binding transcriptional regulator YhcF (GntR family)
MEFNDSQAIYLQIADLFCENILMEKWKPNDRIPSVREMAVNVEVNPNTVMRTYNYLQEKDIIFNKRGIGYFISENGYEKTMELKKQDFIHHDLPRVFRTMELLKIDIDDLQNFHKEFTTSSNNDFLS